MNAIPMWITEAAERFLDLEAVRRAATDRERYHLAEAPQHVAYVTALRKAYRQEGLPVKARDMNGRMVTLRTDPADLVYGSASERAAVYVQIVEVAREIERRPW